MSVGINNIISVDFDIVTESASLGAYETVVYFTGATLYENAVEVDELLCKNFEEVEAGVSDETARAIQSAKVFFENGGAKILFVKPSGYTLSAFKDDIERIRVNNDNFIFVNITNALIGETVVSDGENSYSIGYSAAVLQEIADHCDKTKSPQKIRLCLTTDSLTFIKDNNLLNYNVAVKYTTKNFNSYLLDLSLLIGAYFSKVNLDGDNTIKDYCYTKELVLRDEAQGAEGVTQAQFESLVNNPNGEEGYYNFIDKIGGEVINFGGNYANTKALSIHTDFGAIAVENDITYSVLELMIGKQYLNESGLANIKAAINSQLQRYKTNGYLNVGASYSGEDLVIRYNAKTFNVIKKGTVLSQGFYVFTIPMVNISDADKAQKKFPPIYVIMETQSGARVVEITGEIRA